MSLAPNARAAAPDSADALRAEHDALAARIAVRRSIDDARAGLLLAFLGLLSVGLAVKLAWDRWVLAGPPATAPAGAPLYLWIATVTAVGLLALALRRLLRARRLVREEDALHTRCRDLRARLGLDS
jgi:hypothetical protein